MGKTKKYAKHILKRISLKIPFLKAYIKNHDSLIKAYSNRYKDIGFAPGHYYSAIPSLTEIRENEHIIFDKDDIRDIDFNLPDQIALLQEMKMYYNSIPYAFSEQDNQTSKDILKSKNHTLRYVVKDAWYRYSDVIFLILIMKYFKPKRVIEVGSGHSSAVMLDTNDISFDSNINFTFIEPFPEERLDKMLNDNDRKNVTVIKNKIQNVELDIFKSLQANDILFIDTTHVSKVGSDVNHIIFKILPILKPGVLIHFHDIFYPFEMPKKWIFEKKWFWNEIYILRAFLMNNKDYKIMLFNSMLHKKYRQWFVEEMPYCLIGSEETGSIWIKKLN